MLDRYKGVEGVLYVIIAVIGVPVNLLAIVVLSRGKCGLTLCTSRYLVAMAAADLLVIVSEVILARIKYRYFPLCFLHVTAVCSVVLVLRRAASDCSVWFTVAFTFDRFVLICCQKLKAKYCTGETAAVVLTATGLLLCLKDVPFYFTQESEQIIDDVPFFCGPKDSYYIDPLWVLFDWFDMVLTPLFPFALILLLNALTVRHIFLASLVRKGLRGQKIGENHRDIEMESRQRSVALLFSLSGCFILLWMPFVAEFIYYQISGTGTDPSESELVFHFVGYLLSNFSCCTNTFIYAVTQSKFREQVKSIVKYPVTSVLQLANNIAP